MEGNIGEGSAGAVMQDDGEDERLTSEVEGSCEGGVDPKS
jgi:hypothetical protein